MQGNFKEILFLSCIYLLEVGFLSLCCQVALEQKILMPQASELQAQQMHVTTAPIFTHKMLILKLRHKYYLEFKDNLGSQRNLILFMCKCLIA